MIPREHPPDDILPGFAVIILGLIVALFGVANLPWHLDDLDQAKQAYVSYQMIENGKWLMQEMPDSTPNKPHVATKPPLQGWLSAGAYLGFGARGWEFAWRLPAFLAALLILRALWREGYAIYGNNIGSMLAASAFGLNFYVPRLATLVRTDMLLTAFIFFIGLRIVEKLRTAQPWTFADRAITCLLLLGSTLTKGPIAYGFLLPGIVAFLIASRKREMPRHVWAGWFVWLLPLALFGGWVWWGITSGGGTEGEFYKQVVEKEFLGRFTVGEGARHHNFPPGFYTLALLGRTLPWTLLLVALLFAKPVRAACKHDAVLLWLVCWTFGGLVFMECVPSKRFDRILPVVPPMCLLLAALARSLPGYRLGKEPVGRIAILLPLLAAPLATGYAGWKIFKGFRDDARALVAFGERTRAIVGERRDRLAVVNGKDEGMLMYAGAQRFTGIEEALTLWRFRRIDWLVLGDNDFTSRRAALEPFEVVASTPPLPEKFNHYRLLQRPAGARAALSPLTAPAAPPSTSFIPPVPEQPKVPPDQNENSLRIR